MVGAGFFSAEGIIGTELQLKYRGGGGVLVGPEVLGK